MKICFFILPCVATSQEQYLKLRRLRIDPWDACETKVPTPLNCECVGKNMLIYIFRSHIDISLFLSM